MPCAQSETDKQAGKMAEKDEKGGMLMHRADSQRSKHILGRIVHRRGAYQLTLQTTITTHLIYNSGSH